MSRLPQLVVVALLVIGVGSLDACKGTHDSLSTGPSTEQSTAQAPKVIDAEMKYGLSPTRDTQITYQPDVIVMERGAEAIRSISSNGLTYTIDASAPGANDIQADKVLMATGRVVGRVLAVERKGNMLDVTLGPVELTDVFKEAHVHYHGKLDTDQVIMYRAPADYPGTSTDLDAPDPNAPGTTMREPDWSSIRIGNISPVGEWSLLPAVQRRMPHRLKANNAIERPRNTRYIAYQPQVSSACDAIDTEAITYDNRTTVSGSGCGGGGGAPTIADILLHGAHFFPNFSQGLSAKVVHDDGAMRFIAYAKLTLNRPDFTFNLDITGGRLNTAEIEMAFDGGLKVGFNGGTHGDFRNYATLTEIPMDASIPIPLHPPFAATFQQAMLIRTMFTSKNAVIDVNGDYALSGKIKAGIVNGNKVGSSDISLTVKQSLAESLTGASPGVNGLVLGYSGRLTAGIGALAFVVGPYANIKATVGATRGSDLSTGLVSYPCKSAEFHTWLAYGVGFTAPTWTQAVSDAITGFLSVIHIIKPQRVILNSNKEFGTVPIKDIAPEYIPAGCGKP